jgi:hypothetical protein
MEKKEVRTIPVNSLKCSVPSGKLISGSINIIDAEDEKITEMNHGEGGEATCSKRHKKES